MKTLSFIGFAICGCALSVLFAMAGHLWLPKSSYLWGLIQISGVEIIFAIVLVAIALFGVFCVFKVANARADAQLPFGILNLGQALTLSVAGFVVVLMIRGIALWLAS